MQVVDDFVAVNRGIAEFHELLIEQCGNETLATFAIALKSVLERALLAEQQNMKPETEAEHIAWIRHGLRSQMKLVDLIEAGDAAGAHAHWVEHIEKAGRVWLKAVGAKGVDLFR
jgi:DNA-binding FadR family transcriptional regulator